MHRFLILLPFCLLILHAQTIEKAAQTGYESIKSMDMKNHLSILASDSLEGRETSYPGQKKAAQYIAGIFKKLNLKPIGDDGTYFQHFDIEISCVHPETKIVIEIGSMKKSYIWGTDFISDGARDTTLTGPAAFVGFTDTELDSTAQAKLVGRVVFVFIGKKDYANDTTKATTLRRLYSNRRDAGAIATLMIPDEEGPATFQHAQQMMRDFGLDKGIMRMKSNIPQVQPSSIHFLVSLALAEEVLRSSGKSLKQLRDEALQNQEFTPIFIDDATVTIDAKVIQETKQTENVLTLLPGSDPDLKAQVVAFTAHYDHLGKNRDGVVYPGADDDGSGTTAVLELAEAFAKNPIKPRRSLLFLTLVGEEKGLLGSQYYVNNPIIPLDQIIADLNMDMVGRIDTIHEAYKDTNYTYIIGSDKISLELDSLLRLANGESEQLTLDYKYNNENDPERYYYRSDHYNFAKNGVPIVFFFDGTHADYHKPSDTIDKILFERMVKIGHVIYDLGWKLGNFDRLLIKKSAQE
ncbi:MAG: M20/M25/M40 family metallo-hydrolase [Bacteroidota bacterium]